MKEPLCIDGFYISPDYSTTTAEDWKCEKVSMSHIKCGGFNYERRVECYQCEAPKEERNIEPVVDEEQQVYLNDGSFDASPYFSCFLLLRCLDVLSSEETIYKSLEQYQPRRIFLARKNGQSLGFCFVEFSDMTVYRKAK